MTQHNRETLLAPCPFCGVEPLAVSGVNEVSHPDNDCTLATLWFTREHWNTRATLDPTGEKA